MPETLHFAPNVPVTLSLIDPSGEWDEELRQGRFQTTTGQVFTLPKPAVQLLYALEPAPGEEIQITKHWKGTPRSPFEWTICLSPRSEQFRAAEETAATEAERPSELAATLEGSIAQAEAKRIVKAPPTLIRKPAKRQVEPQPKLFDRGTGTDGPVAQPQPIPAAKPIPAKVRYPDMLLHITRTVKWALSEANLQLGDGPTQDLISTVYIDAAKRSGVEYDFTEDAR